MEIYNINCKIVDTDIHVSDELNRLVRSIKLNDDFSSYSNNDKKKDLIDLIYKTQYKRFLDTISVFIDIKKLEHFNISDCWVQKYKNKKHCLHVHGTDNSKLSFVWYVNASNKSSPILFYNPGFPYNDFWAKEIYPKKNKFLMFNSYIPHEVAYNEDNDRMVLSGNIDLIWQK